MRILYLSHTRFPSEKAYGMQIAQVCHAMAGLEHEVTLVAPGIRTTIEGGGHGYYGVPESFEVVRLPTFDAINSRLVPGKLSFAVTMWSYRRALKKFLRQRKADLLYVRSSLILRPLLDSGMKVVLELHTLPKRGRLAFVKLCDRTEGIVCLTSPMAEELRRWGVRSEKILVEPDGVNLAMFANLPDQTTAKREWGLPPGHPVIGYAGSLVTQDVIQKGVGELLQAFALLKQRGQEFLGWIVGGPEAWARRYHAEARTLGIDRDVCVEGQIDPSRVPSALRACDVLVYPAPASEHPYFRRDTSPLKLFEYMASGVPIVCADLPPIRDVVDASVVRFCKAGDAESLADAIGDVLRDPHAARERAERAKERVRKFAWGERMKRVLQRVAAER